MYGDRRKMRRMRNLGKGGKNDAATTAKGKATAFAYAESDD